MASLILVTGGTGTLGKLVVPRLREAGANVRVLSRQAREPHGDVEYVRGDLDTGAGIEAVPRAVADGGAGAGQAAGDPGGDRDPVPAGRRGRGGRPARGAGPRIPGRAGPRHRRAA